MTQDEWLTAANPWGMLECDRGVTNPRKLNLFACACCRSVWYTWPTNGLFTVERLEQFPADSAPEIEELQSHTLACSQYGATASTAANGGDWLDAFQIEQAKEAALLRDIFGNPFRPVTFNPTCLTTTVTSLAEAIYADPQLPSGHFDNVRLHILADALEEAGCDNTDVLNHCRSAGPHVRGCWLIDLLLRKS